METQFSKLLRQIRQQRAMKQCEMANLIGCEQSYLCGLERGHKLPPQKLKLESMIKKMNLSYQEAEQLREAANNSVRQIKIPQNVEQNIRDMCRQLELKLPSLSRDQVKLINLALTLSSKEEEAPKM